MFKKIFTLLLAATLCFTINVAVFADDYVFTDRNGNKQVVPAGEYSFATRVVEFTHGNPWTKSENRQQTESVLGEPDQDSDNASHSLTLGAGGMLTVEFNILITDGEGDDLYIFEQGPQMEDTKVELSRDLVTWHEVGITKGSTAGLDINGKVPEGESFRYLRLTDMKEYPGGDYPGAEIDAIAGLNVKPVTSTWAEPEIERAFEYELVPEILEHAVLDESITRLEFAAVSVKVYEKLSGTKALPSVINPFTDCADIEMLKAFNLGITKGISDTEFAPDILLNREQAATMLTRVFKRATMNSWTLATDSLFTLPYEKPPVFADDSKISDWAKDSVYFMAANGIINGVGDNKFAPSNTTTEEEATGYANATREQALLIAVRMVENLK